MHREDLCADQYLYAKCIAWHNIESPKEAKGQFAVVHVTLLFTPDHRARPVGRATE